MPEPTPVTNKYLAYLEGIERILNAVSSAISILDYFSSNVHEKRVQIGFDNITQGLAILNRNLTRCLADPLTGAGPENLSLVRSDASDESMIILDGFQIPETSNFELLNGNLKKVSTALTKMMSKTVSNPEELIFETTQTVTKNADNFQTMTFNASVENMNLDLTDLIKQFKINVNDKEFSITEVLINLLKVSPVDPYFKSNLPDCLLALRSADNIEAIVVRTH